MNSRPGMGGIRFPDPLNIINIKGQFEQGRILLLSDTNYLILIVVILFIIFFLVIRWIIIALFYKKLALEDKVSRNDIPDLFNIVDKYNKTTKLKRIPDISLTHTQNYCPFVVGIRKTTLVLSPKLIEILTASEKETVIYHELSHIKRKDNLIGWIALILRDLNFFNPFGYFAYFLIRSEQETDSDKLALKYSGKTPKEIANDILNSIKKIIMLEKQRKLSKILIPPQVSTFLPIKMIYQKKLSNRINSVFKTNPDKIYSRIFPRILLYFSFIFLLLVQLIFIIKINSIIILLR